MMPHSKPGARHLHLALESFVVAYAILSAVQWRHSARWLYEPPVWGYCGNIVSDPFTLLINIPGPIAGCCVAGLMYHCLNRRRWPWDAVAASVLFVVASAGLACEVSVLDDYGFELGRIWWLPWR